jgi:small subunit ribosomal protein S17
MAARGQYGGRKVREGVVVSDKMQKTVVVAVEANMRHRLYKKIVRRVRRYMAHDESDGCSLGDRVRIVEQRPLSRHKRWRVVEVLRRAELPELAAESIDLDLLGEVKTEVAAQASEEAPAATVAEEAAPEVESAIEEAATEAEAEVEAQASEEAPATAVAEEAAPEVESAVEEAATEAEAEVEAQASEEALAAAEAESQEAEPEGEKERP